MKGRKNITEEFYHVTTDGLKKAIIFRNNEDFIYGMNCTAICAVHTDIELYAFCLMSNHVHFIIKGDHASTMNFIKTFKNHVSRRLSIKYKESGILSEADISVCPIFSTDYLLTAIAYVLRNPMAANIPVLPTGYRWSSARAYFSDFHPTDSDTQKISEMTFRKRRELLHTDKQHPDDLRIDRDGLICLEDYIEYQKVEEIFYSPKRFMFYLSKNNDADIEMDTGILKKALYRDQELLASMETISQEMFKRRYANLSITNRIDVAKKIRKEYGVPISQLGRVTGLEPSILKALF